MAARETEDQMAGAVRLTLLGLIDPVWCEKVQEFAAFNPEFLPFLHIAPGNNNRNDGNSGLYAESPSDVIKGGRGGIKEYLKWYALSAGVRATYAYDKWYGGSDRTKWYTGEKKGVRVGDYSSLTEKKRTIMEAIDKLPEITTEQELVNAGKVKGVGVGAINSALTKFFARTDNVAYTDRAVVQSLRKVYEENLTLSKIKTKVEAWKGDKSVGEAWCFMIYHYVLKL